ncbi:MAG: hypothetical protein EON56_06110 [Alphaproteobacteria bacterium]|nr:MAG: hypothetical protein EON56_06110 [Alphaproteobacteria bacterium]
MATSVDGLRKAMQNAAADALEPPAHSPLRREAKAFWPAIIASRARDEWDANALTVAGQLAECQAAIQQESESLRVEGNVITDGRAVKVNPRFKAVDILHRREMALMRTLRMGGRVSGDQRDALGKRYAEQKAREIFAKLRGEDGDELLA